MGDIPTKILIVNALLLWKLILKIIYKRLNTSEVDRIIEMAWEDRTPFEAINFQFNLKEKEVINLMRSNLKKSSFKLWRKRVSGRKSKHWFADQAIRFKSPNQK
ncbi:TIGR03643 family protein [Prochlorococcus sp. MIT 0916]|uniref:TIGR03643 family protein n=1 Tax=Prochlorococcus sp. MIT 0916 TaxID=3082521 RepID=UPI0039B5C423